MNAQPQTSWGSDAGHWYRQNGEPCYEIVGKNGKLRATTLRDARELDLVPSVTTILKLEAAPALESWKVRQAMLACLTLPRDEWESEDAFMSRALEDSREQAKKAAERGTYLHGLLESAVRHDGVWRKAPQEVEIIEPALIWLNVNFPGYTWSPEKSFACQHGFGGKIDLQGSRGDEHVVIDYKFKADIVAGKKLAYDNHSTQMAAYVYGVGKRTSRAINLFISSTEPGLIVPHEWTAKELEQGWAAFQCLLKLWQVRRGL